MRFPAPDDQLASRQGWYTLMAGQAYAVGHRVKTPARNAEVIAVGAGHALAVGGVALRAGIGKLRFSMKFEQRIYCIEGVWDYGAREVEPSVEPLLDMLRRQGFWAYVRRDCATIGPIRRGMVRRHANTDTRFSIDNQPLLPRAARETRMQKSR